VFNLNVPLTINNCSAAQGGGIFALNAQIVANSRLTLLDNTAIGVVNPFAGTGAGMYLSATKATLSSKARFERNVAPTSFGGALYAGSTLRILLEYI
jgi:predicted outer membrane repeat protein